MIDFLQAFLSAGVGALVGSLIGMLPGVGPTTGIAILLPFVLGLPPYISFPFITAVYYGTQYGGSTSAILFKIPGEASSVVTCLDGHELAKQNRSGTAIAVVALSSFFAGIVTAIMIYAVSPMLASLAILFTPVETFCLSVFSLYFAGVLFSEDKLMAVFTTSVGLFLSFIGISTVTGEVRFTHGIDYLFDGINIAIIVAGLLGGPELVKLIMSKSEDLTKLTPRITSLGVTKDVIKETTPSAVRGTIVGSLLGLVPGGGGVLASYLAYYTEKLFTPQLGSGKLQGVAAPEAANNASVQTAFIPLLVFGVPENAVMSLILGLMLQQGIPFGITLFNNDITFVQILVTSMIFGNLFLLLLNLPMIKILAKIYKISLRTLFIATALSLIVGIYLINRNPWDILTLLLLVVFGLALLRAKISVMPLIMGFVLGPIIEDRFIKSMIMRDSDISMFFTNFVSISVFSIIILYCLGKYLYNRRQAI